MVAERHTTIMISLFFLLEYSAWLSNGSKFFNIPTTLRSCPLSSSPEATLPQPIPAPFLSTSQYHSPSSEPDHSDNSIDQDGRAPCYAPKRLLIPPVRVLDLLLLHRQRLVRPWLPLWIILAKAFQYLDMR